jgi:hypothetical protein
MEIFFLTLSVRNFWFLLCAIEDNWAFGIAKDVRNESDCKNNLCWITVFIPVNT